MTEAVANLNESPQADPRDIDPNEMLRFYSKAKHAEWSVDDLEWGEIPPFPEAPARLSDEKKARRNDIWRSVITQQLQADELAVLMSTQLLREAKDPAAKLYYTTMVDDEARHTEAWLRLMKAVGNPTARDPELDNLVHMVLEADTLEEKVFLMQVFYEKAVIGRFIEIIKGAGGTLLAKLCGKLKVDDGIHHGSGMAYERILLASASKKTKQKVARTAGQALPHFVGHVMWRPEERSVVGQLMRKADLQYAKSELEDGVKRASSLGLDFSGIDIPAALTRYSS